MKCAVLCCNNNRRHKRGMSFFRFPKEQYLSKAWLEAIGRPDYPPKESSNICENHFNKSYLLTRKGRTVLRRGALPEHPYNICPRCSSHQPMTFQNEEEGNSPDVNLHSEESQGKDIMVKSESSLYPEYIIYEYDEYDSTNVKEEEMTHVNSSEGLQKQVDNVMAIDERKFVQLIRNHPEIYNSSHEDFRKNEKKDAAWLSISKEMQKDVPSLIKRWKHIRRSLLQHLMEPNKTNGYYLIDSLDFYLPYMKSEGPSKPFKTESDESDAESTAAKIKADDSHDENTNNISESATKCKIENNVSFEDNESVVNYTQFDDPLNINIERQSASSTMKPAAQDEEVDPEKTFLLLLCPDFKALDDKRKRKFQVKVTQLLRDLHKEMATDQIDTHANKSKV